MISVLAFSGLLVLYSDAIPVQYMPASQNPFERTQTVLPSSDMDKFGIYFFNDQETSDKALEAADTYAKGMSIIQVSRLEANGSVTSWDASGRPLANPLPLDQNNLQGMQPGEVGIVFQFPLPNPMPTTTTDKPQVFFGLDASKRNTGLKVQRAYMLFERIGTPTSKYSNLRLSVRSTRYIGTCSKDKGATSKVDDVTFTVQDLMPDQGDKRDHLEVIQKGQPNLGSFQIAPVIDWSAYEKDFGPTKNRPMGGAKLIRKPGEQIDYDNQHLDVFAPQPYKYWSALNVYQGSSIRGYLSHVATQPN